MIKATIGYRLEGRDDIWTRECIVHDQLDAIHLAEDIFEAEGRPIAEKMISMHRIETIERVEDAIDYIANLTRNAGC